MVPQKLMLYNCVPLEDVLTLNTLNCTETPFFERHDEHPCPFLYGSPPPLEWKQVKTGKKDKHIL